MRPGRAVLALAALLAALLGSPLFTAPEARAAVYWASSSWVGAANLDGSWSLISYPYEIVNVVPSGATCGLAVNSRYLYWADQGDGTIGRMELSPSPEGLLDYSSAERVAIDESLISGLVAPCGVAVDSEHLYWADQGTHTIGRARIDGGSPERNLILTAASPCGVAVDAGHVYWGSLGDDSIGRAKLDGSGVEPKFVPAIGDPCGVAVDSAHIYWSDGKNGIGRAAIDGSAAQPGFIPAPHACGVAVDSSGVYWGIRSEVGNLVGRANLDGSGAGPLVTEQSYAGGCGVAVDSRLFRQDTSGWVSEYLRFGPVVRDRHGGGMTVELRVPAAGELTVDSPRVGWRIDKRERPRGAGGALVWKLKLWPGKGTRAARRIHRELRRTGRSQIVLKLTYRQGERKPLGAEKRLFFRVPTERARRDHHSRR